MKKIVNINWLIHKKDTGSAMKSWKSFNADKIEIKVIGNHLMQIKLKSKLFSSSVHQIDKVCDHMVQKDRLDPFYFFLFLTFNCL